MLGLALDLSQNRTGTSAPVAYPATLFAGAAGAYYDPSDLSSMFQTTDTSTPAAVNSPVGRISDKSGNNNHALQATAGLRPILRNSGALYWLEFDGTDDKMTALFAITQPFDRVSGLQHIVTAVLNRRVFGGGSATAGLLYNQSTQLTVFDGSAGPVVTNPLATVDFVATERHANASSRLALDNGAYVTTPASGATVPGGVTLGNDHSAALAANIRFYGALMIARNLTDPETADLRTHFAAKQGRVL